jgi:hypothetical protein
MFRANFRFLCTLFLVLGVNSSVWADKEKSALYDSFENNPYIVGRERDAIAPYLLPKNHPMKETLDSIFSATRATLNDESFEKAGFITKFKQPRSFIRVASHPEMPGFLIKCYLDSERRVKKDTPGWVWFTRRIEGVNRIHEYIQRNNVQFFVAPKKFLYALPAQPDIPTSSLYTRKNVVLLVEDMGLVSKEENKKAWREVITEKHLDEFYGIITGVPGGSYRADNVAYTKDGKFAFIDTEYRDKKTSVFSEIIPYLSPEMIRYWDHKVKSNGRF